MKIIFGFALFIFCATLISAQTVDDCDSWSYSGETGPEFWSSLCNGQYRFCGVGAEQSPINLNTVDTSGYVRNENILSKLKFDYRGYADVSFENTGHSLRVIVPLLEGEGDDTRATKHSWLEGGRINGVEYRLVSYEIHSPSEHTFNGEQADMEVQFLHQRVLPGDPREMEFIIVSVLYNVDLEKEAKGKKGKQAAILKGAWQEIFESGGLVTEGVTVVDSYDFGKRLSDVKTSGSYFSYDGSYTTPPCSETVEWYVLEKPVEMRREQLIEVQRRIPDGNNARPVQKPGQRAVYYWEKSSSSQIVIPIISSIVLAIFSSFFF